MNRKIFKYTIQITELQEVDLPIHAKILCVQIQDSEPRLWALVEPNAPVVRRHIRIIGTGHPIPDDKELEYINTFQEGPFVWHVFERLE